MLLWQTAIATSLILCGGPFGLTIHIYEHSSSGLYWRYIVFYYCQQRDGVCYSHMRGDMIGFLLPGFLAPGSKNDVPSSTRPTDIHGVASGCQQVQEAAPLIPSTRPRPMIALVASIQYQDRRRWRLVAFAPPGYGPCCQILYTNGHWLCQVLTNLPYNLGTSPYHMIVLRASINLYLESHSGPDRRASNQCRVREKASPALRKDFRSW